MCQCVMLIVFLAFFSVNKFVTSFNVDSFNYAAYNGPDTSMFGFSLAFHKTHSQSWLIVGAPEAQSSYQQGVIRGGVVYQCPTGTDGDCREIPFDTKGHNKHHLYHFDIDNKTEQWFGATVSSSGTENGRIVACAPRYTWHPRNQTRRDPVGTCYVSDENLQEFNEYSPCRTFQWGYHRQGSCQAGLSAALNTRKNRLFVGAPGSTFWQGRTYSIDANEKFKFRPVLFSDSYGAEGQVLHQSLDRRPAVFSTPEQNGDYDNTYMGYSMTAGNFFNSSEDGIAVGIPRDKGLKGNVKIMTWNLTTEYSSFSSDQVGSYFGYALAVSDVDGDGQVDLIVGAPMYTKANNKGKYDVGRVYVYYQNSHKGKFVQMSIIDGFNTKSRFGQALASLGDVNLDGYGDFAIGAPYDGPNYQGAVYIYHGSKTGIRNKYSQVIYAEDIVPIQYGSLATFGFSITGGLDLDHNNYPDMAVGAYLSNKAFFFRSRPVVWVDAVVNFRTLNKQVDIKQSNYVLRSGGNAVRTQIDFCIKYSGQGIPHFIDVDLQYILDSKKQSEYRMGFVNHEKLNVLNETIRLQKDDNNTCITKDVYVLSDVRDKLTPLAAEVKYSLREDASAAFARRDPSSVLRPILDLNSPPSRSDAINIQKECGPDNVCTPNLQLTVTPSVDKYMLDSEEYLFLDILVSNVGEDSYDTILELHKPENVLYAATVDKKSSVNCNWKVPKNETTIRCEIGNPIPKDKIVDFKIKLQPKFIEDHVPSSYDFYVTVNSTNPELDFTLNDNSRNVSVGIFTSSPLEVRGKSYPAEIFINSSNFNADLSGDVRGRSETEIGPQIFHEYYLRNDGPTSIEEAEMIFVWPSKTKSGEDFVYLLEHFSSNPKVICEQYRANSRGFQLEFNRKSIWEMLNLDIEEDSSGKVHSVVGGGAQTSDESLNTIVASSGDGSEVHAHRQNQITSSGSVGANGDSSTTITQSNQYTGSGQTHFTHSNSTHFRNASGVYVSSTGEMTSRGGGQQSAGWQQGQNSWSGQGQGQGQSGSSSSQQGWQTSGGSSSNWQNGGGAGAKLNITYTCKEEVNGVYHDIPCGPNGEFPAFNSSYYQSRFGGNFRPVGSSVNVAHQCFQTINGIERKVDCKSLKGFNETYFNQQQFINGGGSSAHYNQGSSSYQSGSGSGSGSQYSGSQANSGASSAANYDQGSSSYQSGSGTGSQYSSNQANSGASSAANYNQGSNRYQSGSGSQYSGNQVNSGASSAANYNQGSSSYQSGSESQYTSNQEDYRRREEYQRQLEERRIDELRRQEERRREEEEKIRKEEEKRRIDEKLRVEEAQRAAEARRVAEEYRKAQEARRTEERKRLEEEWKVEAERRRLEEVRRVELERQRYEQQYGRGSQYSGSSQYAQGGRQSGGSQYSQSSQHGQGGRQQYSGSQYSQNSGQQYDSGEDYNSGEYVDTQNQNGGRSGSASDRDTAIGAITGTNRNNNKLTVATLDLGDISGNYGHSGSTGSSSAPSQQNRKWAEETHWSETQQIPPTYVNNVERDNVPTDRPSNARIYGGRKKRQLVDAEKHCQSMQCDIVKCKIQKLNYKEDVTFVFRSRINARAVKDISNTESMKFSSMMQARVSKLKYNAKPEDEKPYVREVFTTISSSETKLKPDIVPLWVVVLSAVAGIIILLLIILCCSKLGFFNRNRREHTAETQPLQGNGYHDDAHL